MLTAIPEETLSASYDHGIDHQPIFIDEVLLLKRVDKLTAAENQHIPLALLLDPPDGLNELILDQAGIPLYLGEGGGNHVLGQAVHTVTIRPRAGRGRPEGSKLLIGRASQQKHIAGVEFISFKRLLVFPLAPLKGGPLAWGFYDAIQRHEF